MTERKPKAKSTTKPVRRWRVYSDPEREFDTMTHASFLLNAREIRANPSQFDVLLDEPGILMWRWRNQPTWLITYLDADKE